jgi:phosphoglycolate phosphatase-like HAD superfamily hydrolase
MNRRRFTSVLILAICFLAIPSVPRLAAQSDPLPSWNDTVSKRAILDFVHRTTTTGSPEFIPIEQRITTFDNDGTLWVEQPMYTQLAFILTRIKELAPKHPEWKTTQPFQGVLEGDIKAVLASGEKGLMQLFASSSTGMNTEEFEKIAKDWLATAKHPKFDRLYTDCIYQPMLEVLAYLRANGFKTYIVSGGGVEFMRPFTQQAYGIPPEQVIGSTIKTKFEMNPEGRPVLMRLPELDFIDDQAGKPVNINKIIGRRPVAAFGNSDGDLQMLQWTAAGAGARLMLLVHHDDPIREYAYDRKSHVGQLDKAWDQAVAKHWIVVSMKDDWKTIFPPQIGK